MIPPGVLLLAFTGLVLLSPWATREMTPVQQRRWEAGLAIGCAVLLLVVVAAGVYGLRTHPL